MTAEIGILNKEAVAIAADSAVTMQQGKKQKIFQSANKIFSLSKYHPIGIMVYGDAELMQIPWETIIKVYRKELSFKKFTTLERHAQHFINFLDGNRHLFPESEQKRYFELNLRTYLYFQIINPVKDKIKEIIDQKKSIAKTESLKIMCDEIDIHYKAWQKFRYNPSANKTIMKSLKKKYGKIIVKVKKDIFEKIPLTATSSRQITIIALSLFVKSPDFMPYDSGVVIAGFGKKDVFPSIKSFYVDGVANHRLVYKEDKHRRINHNINAAIVPFAQKEVVSTFMEGVEPRYEKVLRSSLSEIFELYPSVIIDNINKLTDKEKKVLKIKTKKMGIQMLNKYRMEFLKYQQENFVNPVMRIVAILPKDELAAMAEALVNLTSFRRRISEEAETVAGPIDVAVISKGDGFIWIKRKHYFKPELNIQFLKNYYRKDVDNE